MANIKRVKSKLCKLFVLIYNVSLNFFLTLASFLTICFYIIIYTSQCKNLQLK